MLRSRSIRTPARFSRQLTRWGLTLLATAALFLTMSVAYELMVGEYSVSPAASRAVRPVLVNGPETPTPAQRHEG